MGTVPGDGLKLPQVPRRIGSVRPVGLQTGPWLFYWFGYGVGFWLCLSPSGGGAVVILGVSIPSGNSSGV